MRPLEQFGSPILDAVGPVAYCQLNSMLDANYPKGDLASFIHRGERLAS